MNRLPIARINSGGVARAPILLPLRIAAWLAGAQSPLLAFAVAGDVDGLWWFAHNFISFTGCCPLPVVGHSVKAGTRAGSAGAFGSCAPSTSSEVMSGAAL